MTDKKTGNIGNNQEKRKETRGRKPLLNPSVKVSWRIPYDVYQLLENEQKRLELELGCKPTLPIVFNGLVKKQLN